MPAMMLHDTTCSMYAMTSMLARGEQREGGNDRSRQISDHHPQILVLCLLLLLRRVVKGVSKSFFVVREILPWKTTKIKTARPKRIVLYSRKRRDHEKTTGPPKLRNYAYLIFGVLGVLDL